MTRQEFIENVNEWWELLEFCSDEDCGICDDIIDSEARDSEIEEDLPSAVREYDYSWTEVRDMLHEISEGFDYYRRDGMFDYCGMDGDDFTRYKSSTIEWMDSNHYWDEANGENDNDDDVFEVDPFGDDDPVEDEPDDDFDIDEEGFSIGDLLDMCSVTLIEIQRNILNEQKENDAAFKSFIDVNVPKVLR